MARILVTGGAGFIGSHVVHGLVAGGAHVVVLDDFSTGKRERIPHGPQMTVVEGDVADIAVVKRAMQGCEHVVHLAALTGVGVSVQQPEKTFRVNVQGTQAVLEAARELQLPGRVLYASSAAVYGPATQPRVTEAEAANVPLKSPYAASKIAAEALGRMYADTYGLRTTGLRIFNVYGPGQDPNSPYSGLLSLVVNSVETGELLQIYGNGQQTRDYILVQDVAGVIRTLLGAPVQFPLPQILNIGTGLGVSLLDVIRHIVALKRVNPRVEYRPARENDGNLSAADVSLLKTILPGWAPAPVQAGVRVWLG